MGHTRFVLSERIARRAVTARRTDLLQRVARRLSEQESVAALWLGGSLADGGGDAWSDIDLYAAVADEAWAEFSRGLPAVVREIEELAYYREFAPPRSASYERVWLFYFRDLPLLWKLDCHVQRVSAAVGTAPQLDLSYRRELACAPRRALHDPAGILLARPTFPAPAKAVFRRHVAEAMDGLLALFAGATRPILRGDFWAVVRCLEALHRGVLHLLAIEADAACMGDDHLPRLRRSCDPMALHLLDANRFDASRSSMARAALRLLALFEDRGSRLCDREQVAFPQAMVQRVRAVLESANRRRQEAREDDAVKASAAP